MALLTHFDDFLLYLETEGYSHRTIYSYERDLKMFANFLEEVSSPFDKLDKKTINQYKSYLLSLDRKTPLGNQEKKTLSATSVNRALSVLRSYLSYLLDIDYVIPLAPQAIKLVKGELRKLRVAELEEFIRLMEAPQTLERDTRVKIRNQAILETLFSTGVRIAELVSLNRNHIDGSGRILVYGKGKKERFVYLTPRAERALEAYLTLRTDDSPALFVPYRGRNVFTKNARISANYIQMKIKKYRELLRINIPTTAHSFRRAFATFMAEKGASTAALQLLLGHSSPTTTNRYINMAERFAEEAHRKFHPLP